MSQKMRMMRSEWVAVWLLWLFAMKRVNGECECGFEENSTGVCVLVDGVELGAGRECNLPTDRFCDDSSVNATCECGCYWAGVNCDERLTVDPGYQAIALIFPLLVLFGAIAYIVRHERMTASSDWNVPSSHCVDSPYTRIGPRMILAYRTCMAIISLSILGIQMTGDAGFVNTFTTWNWTLIVVYFVLGFALSLMYVIRPSNRERLNYAERLFWIVLAVECTSAILVSVVFWGILYPTSSPEFQEVLVEYKSIFQHACNVPMMFIDFFVIYLPIQRSFYPYIAAWGATYCSFHASRTVHGLTLENGFFCEVYFFLEIDTILLTPWTIGFLLAYYGFLWITTKLSTLKISLQAGVNEDLENKKDEDAQGL